MKHEHEEYDEACPHCRPILVDPRTRRLVPADAPAMVAVRKAWPTIPLELKRAWFRFTVKNEHTTETLRAMDEIARRLGAGT